MNPARSIRGQLMRSIVLRSFKKAHVIGMFVLSVGLLATSMLIPSVGNAQDARVAKSMAALKNQTTKLGALFVKSGDDYIRIATNVSTRIGRRGLGTILTGAALKSIKEGNPYYGKTSILGTAYVSGYEPIKDISGATIGVYFVGYTR